jgi:hypothetical protein
MRLKEDMAVISQIKKLGVFSVSLEMDANADLEATGYTTVNYGLSGSEETMSMMSEDPQLMSIVLDTLLGVSFLMTGEEE